MSELWAVTGASGYIGRALRGNLAADDIESRGLARSNADITADIRDPGALRALVRGATVVVHLAAYVHRRATASAAARECWSVNVTGTEMLLAAVRDVSPSAFLLFVSSANVYGPSAVALDESAPCQARTVYGRSKLEAERQVLQAIAAGETRGCVLRPAVIFGPGAPGNLRRLARMVLGGWVVEVDHGSQRKSIVPVRHMVGAIRAVAARDEICNGEVFNVAGEMLTIHEIIKAMASDRAVPPHVISIPRAVIRPVLVAAAVVAPSLAAMVETYISDAVLDGSKLARVTGFSPAESARDELARLV